MSDPTNTEVAEALTAVTKEAKERKSKAKRERTISQRMHDAMTDPTLEKKMSPAKAFIQSLDGDYMSVNDVAAELGVSDALVRKLSRRKTITAPSFTAPFAGKKMGLYTKEDVEELRAHVNTNWNDVQITKNDKGEDDEDQGATDGA